MDGSTSKTNARRFDGRGFRGGAPARNWMMMAKVQEFIMLGWQRHIPPDAGILFVSLVAMEYMGCAPQLQGQYLQVWYDTTRGYSDVLSAEQACAREDTERRFNAEYGKPWDRSLDGLLSLLTELGLVTTQRDGDGTVYYRSSDMLPAPEERLNLSEAEKRYLVELRKQPCGPAEEGGCVL